MEPFVEKRGETLLSVKRTPKYVNRARALPDRNLGRLRSLSAMHRRNMDDGIIPDNGPNSLPFMHCYWTE